jgi:P pilus assembly chaperone PapD
VSRIALAALGAALLMTSPLRAQGVLVAPHAVFMDHRVRSGSLTLYNPGDEPAEIAVSTFFGYPVTDSTGEYVLRTVDTPDSTQPSAAGWIEAFPKRMLLGPKERQTVRLLARPPAGLTDGEYWARVVVSAKGSTVPVAGASDTSGVRVGIRLEVRTVIPLQYRKGPMSTTVRLSDIEARAAGDSLAVRMHLARSGNAAFLGMARGALADSTGKTVASFNRPIAVYYDAAPRLTAALPPGGLQPGRYRLKVEVAAERQDIPPEVLLGSPPVRDSVDLRIP